MKVRKKDHGLYCFRINEKDRQELDEILDKSKARLNKNRDETSEYVITKAQIILEAIRLGLPLVKRERE